MSTYRALEALADPTRRSIFESLAQGPRPVVDIAAGLPISRPAVSQHLKVLKDAGLVSVHPVGTRRVYSIDAEQVVALRDYFDQFWADALSAYAHTVQSTSEEQ